MLIKEAKAITGGGLGHTTKMKHFCRSYSLSAKACQTGTKLREVAKAQIREKGSTDILCRWCYAMKGNFLFPNVADSHQKHLDSLSDPRWVDAMVTLIAKQSPQYFRWHSSGDIQSIDHLEKIVEIARRLPNCKFWLPTQERRYVAQWLKAGNKFPPNLAVNVSEITVGGFTTSFADVWGLGATAVITNKNDPHKPTEHVCPCNSQGGTCGDCRTCFHTMDVGAKYRKVLYPIH